MHFLRIPCTLACTQAQILAEVHLIYVTGIGAFARGRQSRDKGAMTQQDIDKMLPIGFQTKVINHELFSLGAEVVKATECNKKGTTWGSPMATLTIKFRLKTFCIF